MSCTLTSYRVPVVRYRARGDWYAATPWELAEGAYKRMFKSPATGRTRTAWVERSAGGWRWRVTERSVRGLVAQVGIGSREAIKPLARMCFGAADLAAVTK